MRNIGVKLYWTWVVLFSIFLIALSFKNVHAETPSLKGQTIHLYDIVAGYAIDGSDGSAKVCSPPGAQIYVNSDDGKTLIVSIDSPGNLAYPIPTSLCPGGYTSKGLMYTLPKGTLQNERMSSQSWATGILAVPFKFHVSNRDISLGSTVGAYIGYRSTFFNSFAVTPILGGGLALISVNQSNGATSETLTGLSLATGFIGSVTSGASAGVQYGIILGVDWVGRSAGYVYEGKPWVAVEIGYDFGL